MVFNPSVPAFSDENVSVNPSVSVWRRYNTRARWQRYHSPNTSLRASARRHPAPATHARISHSTPVVPHPRVHGLTVQDVDAIDEYPTHAYGHSAHRNASLQSLPRHLRRPAFRRVVPAAIAAIDPDLEEVAIEFIQQKLHGVGERMFASACQTVTKCPQGRLPRELAVVINDISSSPPTHVFAVYSQPSVPQKQRITLHPSHALVLAANCAHLPPLPYSKPGIPEYPGATIFLPAIPLSLQSPETFPILLKYLYTKCCDTLLRSLLPFVARGIIPPQERLTKIIATTCSTNTIQTQLHCVYGFWSNVTALGVFDEKLWQVMSFAWDVLQDALFI